MSDQAQHRLAATIDGQIGHGGALFWRRLSAWRLWTAIAKWLGLIVILLMYIPLVWLAVMSFSGRPLSGIPYPLTMEHYDELFFAFNKWGEPLYESVAMGVVVGIVCMIVATAVGRAMPRMRKPGGVILIALIPLFVPGLTMGAALFISIRSFLDLRLGLWSIFVGHMVWSLPFSLLLVLIIATRFDHRPAGGRAGSRRQRLAPLLGHRVPDSPPRHHRCRHLRLPALLQRAAALDLPARLGDDDADLQLDHDGLAPVPGADHLLAVHDHSGRHPCRSSAPSSGSSSRSWIAAERRALTPGATRRRRC